MIDHKDKEINALKKRLSALEDECNALRSAAKSNQKNNFAAVQTKNIIGSKPVSQASANLSQLSHQQLIDAVNCFKDGFALFDAADKLIMFNDRYQTAIGQDSTALELGMSFEDITKARSGIVGFEKNLDADEAWIRKRIDRHLNPTGPFELNSVGGHTFQIHEFKTPDGGTAVFRIDITQQKKSEQELAKSEERFREAIESLHEGFVLFDTDDRLVIFNDQFKKMRPAVEDLLAPGVTFEELLRTNVKREMTQEAVGREEEFIQQRLALHRNPKGPILRENTDGTWFMINERRTPDGGTLHVETDVTELKRAQRALQISNAELETRINERTANLELEIVERKQTEEALIAAKLEAESLSNVKTNFLANMSHELRTPLNAIIGFSESLLTKTFGSIANEKQEEYLQDIYKSGSHLLKLINDILDVTAIEEGKLKLQDDQISIGALIKEVFKMVGPRARKNKINLSHQFEEKRVSLRADERHLKQILLNLITNAIKFTPENGKVTLECQLENMGQFSFAVTDTGIGMSEADIETAFEPFGQVSPSLNLAHEGTGLGLPLTEQLVIAHGGTIEVESAPHSGTKVTVKFPKERVIS